MLKISKVLTFAFVLGAAALGAGQAEAGFTSFVIRGASSNSALLPAINSLPLDQKTEFVIAEGGQKAGYGSNDINGATIGGITALGITRYDDTTRFTAGSGPAVGPYLNIWVTNGTDYAVLANEPSDGNFQPLFTGPDGGPKSYDLSFTDLANKAVKVYETTNANTLNTWIHQSLNKVGQSLTFNDVANLVIGAPPASYLTGGNGVGTGAPRDLDNNATYGVNWVFGDSLSNYQTGAPGYIVGDAVAAAVPEPTSAVLLGLGALGFGAMRRRRNKSVATNA